MTCAVGADHNIYSSFATGPIEVATDNVARNVEFKTATIAKAFEEIEVWQYRTLNTLGIVDTVGNLNVLFLYLFVGHSQSFVLTLNLLVLLTQLTGLSLDLFFQHLLLTTQNALFLSIFAALKESKDGHGSKEYGEGNENPHLFLSTHCLGLGTHGFCLLLKLVVVHNSLHISNLTVISLHVY